MKVNHHWNFEVTFVSLHDSYLKGFENNLKRSLVGLTYFVALWYPVRCGIICKAAMYYVTIFGWSQWCVISRITFAHPFSQSVCRYARQSSFHLLQVLPLPVVTHIRVDHRNEALIQDGALSHTMQPPRSRTLTVTNEVVCDWRKNSRIVVSRFLVSPQHDETRDPRFQPNH